MHHWQRQSRECVRPRIFQDAGRRRCARHLHSLHTGAKRRRRHDAAFAETLPKSWRPAKIYLPALDILFSPNGTVVGPEASKGVIHLLVNDVTDATQKLFPIDLPGIILKNQSDKRVVTLFTRTGYVTTSEILSLTDYLSTKNQFYYAERGETE